LLRRNADLLDKATKGRELVFSSGQKPRDAQVTHPSQQRVGTARGYHCNLDTELHRHADPEAVAHVIVEAICHLGNFRDLFKQIINSRGSRSIVEMNASRTIADSDGGVIQNGDSMGGGLVGADMRHLGGVRRAMAGRHGAHVRTQRAPRP
jgi:hypothetical protein